MDTDHELTRCLSFSFEEKVSFLTKRNYTVKRVDVITYIRGYNRVDEKLFDVYGVFLNNAEYLKPDFEDCIKYHWLDTVFYDELKKKLLYE